MGAIDSDAHVVECEKTFEYLDPEFDDYKPRVMVQKTDDVVVLEKVAMTAEKRNAVRDFNQGKR